MVFPEGVLINITTRWQLLSHWVLTSPCWYKIKMSVQQSLRVILERESIRQTNPTILILELSYYFILCSNFNEPMFGSSGAPTSYRGRIFPISSGLTAPASPILCRSKSFLRPPTFAFYLCSLLFHSTCQVLPRSGSLSCSFCSHATHVRSDIILEASPDLSTQTPGRVGSIIQAVPNHSP